jgi:hypothetical protein
MKNIGAGTKKVAKWDAKAGFAAGTAWCGIFLGAVMRAVGLQPPSGYAAAHNWSTYGTAVNRKELQPGDIIVYGYNHVAMYIGGGRQIQGNNSNGTVGTSGIGSGLGLGPITAMRRPPYQHGGRSTGLGFPGMSPAERKKFEEIAEHENLGSGFADVVPGVHTIENAAGDAAEAMAEGLANLFASHAEAFMLNLGLVGGGAFLVYYGAALMLGVKQPVKPFVNAAAAVAVAPK